MRRTPSTADKMEGFGDLLHPDEAQEPILARPVRSALMEWLTEIWAADELREVGLLPRQRALFHGAPGTGKTTLAHHLAARLGLPLLAIRPDRVIDCWVGSTGRNIGQLFDLAKPDNEGPVVMFFDEFEAIAHKRIATQQGADNERNASIDVLLQRIEAHDGFIIAATNHADRLDPAIWRRFDIHIGIELPGQEERERIIARYLAPYGLPRKALTLLAESCETASPSLLRQFCEGLKRGLVIGERVGWDMRRDPSIMRLLTSIAPHPEIGKPRLWALGTDDRAIANLPWPLRLAAEIQETPEAAILSNATAEQPDNITDFPGRRSDNRGADHA